MQQQIRGPRSSAGEGLSMDRHYFDVSGISNSSGIYGVRNKITDQIYVGQAVKLKKRLKEHLAIWKKDYEYAKATGENMNLCNSIHKYGGVNFEIVVLEFCPEDALDDREDYWLKYYGDFTSPHTFNIRGAGSRGRLSDEEKQRLSERMKGNQLGKTSFTGKSHTDRAKKILSEKAKGKTLGVKFPGRKKPSEAANKRVAYHQKGVIPEEYSGVYKDIENGMTNPDISRKYKIDVRTVRLIKNKNHWTTKLYYGDVLNGTVSSNK